jgi:hypothetical protein
MEIDIYILVLLVLLIVVDIYLYVSVPHHGLAGNPYSAAPVT